MTISHIASMDSDRRRIIVLLIGFAVVDSLIAVFAYGADAGGIDLRTRVTDAEVMVTEGIAATIGIVVALRSGFGGLHGRTYVSLAIGLSFWFAGETVWTIYEAVLQVDMPAYTLADVFWISGYPFFAYHLFKMYAYFARIINRKAIAVTACAVGLGISFLVYQMAIAADFSKQDAAVTFVFRTAYAVGDFVLILPALLLLATLRRALLHFSPWFFISLSLLITAAADGVFSYVSITVDGDNEWISNLLYDTANLCMAGGLYWYNKFVIMDTRKAPSR